MTCRHVGSAGLKSLLLDSHGVTLVADRPHGPEAVSAAERYRPAIILVGCDGMNNTAVELLRSLHGAVPNARVIAFSSDVGSESVRRVVDAGVTGYLKWTEVSGETLNPMLDLALDGKWIGSEEAISALAAGHERRSLDELGLSPQERLLVDALNGDTIPKDMDKRVPLSPKSRQRARLRLFQRFKVQTDYMLGKCMAAYDPDR